MLRSSQTIRWAALLAAVACTSFSIARAEETSKVSGSFLVNGVEAGLKHVRAARVELEPGKTGFVALLTANSPEGDIQGWRTAEPAERGSFLVVTFEPNGAIWVAELGHVLARTGRFGVVTEIQKVAFEVKGDRLSAHLKTPGEQTFGEDTFTLDLTFEAKLEN